MKYLWKGNIVDEGQIDINLHDRGYQFGDGIYEFVRVYNGKMFYLEDHLVRLENSAKLIDMKLPYSQDEIRSFLEELVIANDLYSGNVYIQVTRGDGIPRRHDYPSYENQHGVVLGFVSSYRRPTEKIENGVKAILYPDLRWSMCNSKTLNLLPNCMAISEAKKKGADKAILYRDGYITEERAGNVFAIKDGIVYTHPDGPEILSGITKKIIFDIMEDKNIPYVERRFRVEELLNADEIIVSDTKTECCPIVKVDDKIIGNGKRGLITKIIDEGYKELIKKHCGKVT